MSRRRKKEITLPGLKPSAVLLPIFKKNQEIYILFTRRTNWVENHKGQISFPGGSFQESDASLRDTALRESEEEIGLKEKDFLLLGELDDAETRVSNYRITPYVAAIPHPYTFKIDEKEVESIIELPVKAFLNSRNFFTESEDGTVHGPHFKVKGHVIWGATARILINFLSILCPQEWESLNEKVAPVTASETNKPLR